MNHFLCVVCTEDKGIDTTAYYIYEGYSYSLCQYHMQQMLDIKREQARECLINSRGNAIGIRR